MKIYSREELNEKTVVELRELAKRYGISGVSKARKDDIIDEIETYYSSKEESDCDTFSTSNNKEKPVYINANIHSILGKDDTYKSLISVSCGASSSNYPVVGKSVSYVKEIYREILNIEVESSPLVNGKQVKPTYILKSGDTLEFVKKAGTKG